jgi:hypothetical protein
MKPMQQVHLEEIDREEAEDRIREIDGLLNPKNPMLAPDAGTQRVLEERRQGLVDRIKEMTQMGEPNRAA